MDTEGSKVQEIIDDTPRYEVDGEKQEEVVMGSEKVEENPLPSPQQEAEIIKKKYGGLLLRKHPLISKDHERAYFDSADWALGKQGDQKPKGPLEALRPKLQPSPHQQVRSRRSAYAPADGDDEQESGNIDPSQSSPDNQTCSSDVENNSETKI